MRWVSLGAGVALIVLAFAAATRVADTREGLIAEIVTLLAGLAGVSLLLYGLLAGAGRPRRQVRPPVRATPPTPAVRPLTDLLVGAAGITIGIVLLGGLGFTSGFGWALLGMVLLLPMLAGSIYLCVRFARAPARIWKIDLKRLRREKES
ncbi:MAG: hypothetical protein ACREOM_01145 [Candidatus Dormibacteraceae bacterium]